MTQIPGNPASITLAMCSDHAGYELKNKIKEHLQAKGYTVRDFGTDSEASCDYPDYAHPCAKAIESGECQAGIAMCGTGNGIAMTLNKHQGIRAALCGQKTLQGLPASTMMLIYLCFLPGSSTRRLLSRWWIHIFQPLLKVDATNAA